MRSVLFVLSVTSLLILFCLPAFGFRGDITPAMIRMERSPATAGNIAVQGAVSCDHLAGADNLNCLLKIVDAGTGKSFSLKNADAVRKMYMAGATTMAIEGNLTDSATIEVLNASAI
jgi:hypothetical protein